MPHQIFWIVPDVDAPEVSRRLTDAPKFMVAIFGEISGIDMIHYFPSGGSFESAYFLYHILNNFQTLPALLFAKRNKSSLCMYPSPARTASIIFIGSGTHGVLLSGHLKSMMVGREFTSTQDLIAWIKETFQRISRKSIEHVFEEWMDRAERCIAHLDSDFSED
jgi:hypothetical protein